MLTSYKPALSFWTVCLPQLFLEKATVGWICETIEFACSVMLIVCTFYLDNWGPLSPRGKRRADGSPAHGAATVGELGVAALVGSGASQLVLLPHGDSSTATEELRNGSGLEGGSGGGGSRGRQLESAAAAAAGEGGRALPGMLTGHRRGRRRSHEPMGAV